MGRVIVEDEPSGKKYSRGVDCTESVSDFFVAVAKQAEYEPDSIEVCPLSSFAHILALLQAAAGSLAETRPTRHAPSSAGSSAPGARTTQVHH
jgi:hypothetical protein